MKYTSADVERCLRGLADNERTANDMLTEYKELLAQLEKGAVIAPQTHKEEAMPIAWMREWEGDVSDVGQMLFETDKNELDDNPNWIPLYTHPTWPAASLLELVNRFLGWPLPHTVCSDLCATMQGYPHRIGTNLLTAQEARQMFEYVLELENDGQGWTMTAKRPPADGEQVLAYSPAMGVGVGYMFHRKDGRVFGFNGTTAAEKTMPKLVFTYWRPLPKEPS